MDTLLAEDDTQAAELFEGGQPMLLATLGPEVLHLARQLDDFDYPAALETVRDLMRPSDGG